MKHIRQKCFNEHWTTCGVSSRQLEDNEESQSHTCARTATVSLWKTTFGGSLGEKTTKWCAINGEKYDWRQPNRLLVVQTGDGFEQATACKAHAVPQGLCANLINALKLLANQQEDGDGLVQNIVTSLGKWSKKGLTDGLREFIKIDNEGALEVGYLNRSTGTFRVPKPKVPEECPEVTVRENSTELTVRAEGVVH